MNILGFNFDHDASVAVIKNGKIISAISNERISRIDNLITKKSKAGRTRTRSGTTTEEPVATRTGRLSMLSTTSTQAAMTPKKK